MPDVYENFLAMQNALKPNVITDNEDSYFPLNDLTVLGNMATLSPYNSSTSHENTSSTSPMSISSSPGHITDFVTLNATVLGEPHLIILVQPVEKFRFRYKSEMMGTHGSLLGVSNRLSRKKNVPTVRLNNFPDNAVIKCTLVTIDEDHRIPHAHRLVRRDGAEECDDPHYIEVSQQNDFIAAFHGMGIIHTAKKNIKEELIRKMRIKMIEDKQCRNTNITLTVRDEAQIKADAECYQKSMNLNSVALCFQGFITNEHDIKMPITPPVYSTSINNLKSALTGELKICRIDKYTSSCEGGEEVFIFVEKVGKKNIKIKFFELNEDDFETWADYGRFSELDVHHQYAIVFRTPPYKDINIVTPKEVFIQLERPSDSDCSEPIKFTYKPSERMTGRKRTRISHSNSTELGQMTVHQNLPEMDVHMMSNNESTEVSKELKKILDNDRCSSTEFRDFVEHIDLDMYVNLLSNSEEANLTYDGPSAKKQEDDKLFAKNIVMEVFKNIKAEPDKAKEYVKNLLKDRSTYGDSPLHCALRYGQKDIVKHILVLIGITSYSKKLVNIQNSSGKTPLHYAVLQNQSEITKALLILGADPNTSDHCGQTPLHTAVRCPDASSSVEVLLHEKEINIEANTDLGWTPLQLAAEAGSYRAVQFLIEAGADVNNTDMSYGRTALHIAVEGGHKDIVEFLLKKTKIDVNKRNFSGNTALHSAVVTPGAKAREICHLLLKYGANPYIKTHNREVEKNDEYSMMDNIKTEVDMDEENVEECSGQSSFDLASDNPDMLQVVSGQKSTLQEEIVLKQETNSPPKIWLNTDQEKHLSNILDKTEGWKKLADYFNFEYLLKSFQQHSSPTLLLLNYIDIHDNTSLGDLQGILRNIGEKDAAEYIELILSMH